MSRHLRLGIDIDGVLSDFTTSYIRTLELVSGKTSTLPPGEEVICWNFEESVGFSREDVGKAWREINDSPTFWVTLKPYLETQAALAALKSAYAEGHEVYFITNRSGIAPHMQTMVWLMAGGFPTPTVLLSPEINHQSMKGAVARGLSLTHFLDDKPENVWAVKAECPECEVALLSRRYNEAQHFESTARGVKVVKTILEFFQLIVGEERADAIAGRG